MNLEAAIAESGAAIQSAELPSVFGDANQLMLLFQNLLGNALKFRGLSQPEISVDCKPRLDGFWEFWINDNGIGFAPHQAERIFGLFQRLHSREKYSGTGIGLALCKRIVERHGGQIEASSELGQGATFRFTLKEDPRDNEGDAGDIAPGSNTSG